MYFQQFEITLQTDISSAALLKPFLLLLSWSKRFLWFLSVHKIIPLFFTVTETILFWQQNGNNLALFFYRFNISILFSTDLKWASVFGKSETLPVIPWHINQKVSYFLLCLHCFSLPDAAWYDKPCCYFRLPHSFFKELCRHNMKSNFI
jgi:hypothetical protein